MIKIFWVFGFSLAILSITVWLEWPKPEVTVTVCDVGQADAIVVKEMFSQLVIDTGSPDNSVLPCLGNVLPFWDRTIEAVVITHADTDHLGGLASILEHYRVRQVLTTAEAHSQVVEVIGNRSKLTVSGRGDRWWFGSISGLVMWPPKRKLTAVKLSEKNRNGMSLVWRMTYGKDSVWFAGDSDCETEAELIRLQSVGATTYLKVGHHGADTSTCEPFLKVLQPHQAWISVGAKNRYGHPHQKTRLRLDAQGVEVRQTSEEGAMEIILD